MAINRNYTNKEEWDKGYEEGKTGAIKALDESGYKTKQELYVALRMFNKKMAKEHYTDNRKSDDFRAGMETAVQEELEKRWGTVPAEQPKITFNAGGIPGLVGFQIPAGTPQGDELSFMQTIKNQLLEPSAENSNEEKPKEPEKPTSRRRFEL